METAAGDVTPDFTIEIADGAVETRVAELWPDLGPVEPSGRGGSRCLVAREKETQRVLGAARIERTFPPENGSALIRTVDNSEVGEALVRRAAHDAFRNGIRNLELFVELEEEAVICAMLAKAGMPIRAYEVDEGAYFEIDLVSLNRGGLDARAGASPEPSSAARDAVSEQADTNEKLGAPTS